MPSLMVGFVKLAVGDLAMMTRFYEKAFGFVERDRFDLPTVHEVVLSLPDQAFGVVLVHWKDGRALTLGNGHGPIGFVATDVDAAYRLALSEGATADRPPHDAGAMRVAFILDPEGHPIELLRIAAG